MNETVSFSKTDLYSPLSPVLKQPKSPLHSLPTELLGMIFEQISDNNQQQASYVCKQFRKVAIDLEQARILRRAIKNALGNLKEFIQPNIGLLQTLANKVFEIAKINVNKSADPLRMILDKTCKLAYPSWQNHIIETLVTIWKNKGDDTTFLNLLGNLYNNELCSQGNRLHLLGLTKKGLLLEKYQKDLIKFVPHINPSTSVGKIHNENSPFELKEVPPNLYPSLIISPENTFQVGEIVAIDHKGNLIGGRKKLFLGYVREIIKQNGETYYTVSTQRYQGNWIERLVVSPIMLGKIPKSAMG